MISFSELGVWSSLDQRGSEHVCVHLLERKGQDTFRVSF